MACTLGAMNHNKQTSVIINALVRALSHKIRTPLSVITNELAVLESQLNPGETALAQKQCGDISDLLKEAGLNKGSEKEIDLEEVLKGFFPELTFNAGFNTLYVDEDSLDQLFLSLSELLGKETQVDVKSEEGFYALSFTGPSSDHEHQGEYHLLSEYYSEKCGRDTLAAPIADAILLSISRKLSIEVSDLISVEFTLTRSI